MPFLRDGDPRFEDVARKIYALNKRLKLDFERPTVETVKSSIVNNHQWFPNCCISKANQDVVIWISGITVPPYQCGALSVRKNAILFYNCEDNLPFICEKGTSITQLYLNYTWKWFFPQMFFTIKVSVLTTSRSFWNRSALQPLFLVC